MMKDEDTIFTCNSCDDSSDDVGRRKAYENEGM